jgi:hypothetical protein
MDVSSFNRSNPVISQLEGRGIEIDPPEAGFTYRRGTKVTPIVTMVPRLAKKPPYFVSHEAAQSRFVDRPTRARRGQVATLAGNPSLVAPWLRDDETDLDFVVVHSLTLCASNPMKEIAVLSSRLAVGGLVVFCISSEDDGFLKQRPVTSLQFLYGVYSQQCNAMSDEHIVSAVLSREPDFYPDLANMQQVLAYLWLVGLFDFDERALSMLSDNNLKAHKTAKASATGRFAPHKLDVQNLVGMCDLLNAGAQHILVPNDLVVNNNSGGSATVAFRKHLASDLNSPDLAAEHTLSARMFARMYRQSMMGPAR